MLGIRHPVIQGGMLWLADARLAAAVSNAGGLGTVSPYAGMNNKGDSVSNFHQQIQLARQLTSKPFAVNIPLDLPDSGLLVDAALRERAPVVITAAGSPKTYTELLQSNGICVLHVVGSKLHAQYAERSKVNSIIVEGYEAAGRIGRSELPLSTLLTDILNTVYVPVAAAGGIANGTGMAQVFRLGAYAVQMGTRFIATEECRAHPNYKKAILACGEDGTLVTRRYWQPTRSLRSRFIEKLAAMEQSGVPLSQLEAFFGSSRARRAQIEGDIENGDAYAGLSAGKIFNILPAATVIEDIIREYNETLRR